MPGRTGRPKGRPKMKAPAAPPVAAAAAEIAEPEAPQTTAAVDAAPPQPEAVPEPIAEEPVAPGTPAVDVPGGVGIPYPEAMAQEAARAAEETAAAVPRLAPAGAGPAAPDPIVERAAANRGAVAAAQAMKPDAEGFTRVLFESRRASGLCLYLPYEVSPGVWEIDKVVWDPQHAKEIIVDGKRPRLAQFSNWRWVADTPELARSMRHHKKFLCGDVYEVSTDQEAVLAKLKWQVAVKEAQIAHLEPPPRPPEPTVERGPLVQRGPPEHERKARTTGVMSLQAPPPQAGRLADLAAYGGDLEVVTE